jgi:hypothetical protein
MDITDPRSASLQKPRAGGLRAPRAVEISEPAPVSPPIRSGHVDQPKAGILEGELVISGWVLAESGPVQRVVAVADGHVVAHVRADRPRPDVAQAVPDLAHAEASGFRMLLSATVLGGASEVLVGASANGEPAQPIWRLRLGYPAEPVVVEAAIKRSRSRLQWPRRREQPTDAAKVAHVPAAPPPDDPFRIVAIISAYNEGDIIAPVLEHLQRNGVSSYLIDNESSDDTVARAEEWLGRGLIGIESLPAGSGGRTSWKAILARKLELSRQLGADWYLHHDADEIRESPWPGMSLREAVNLVDRLGYNAIDFRVLNFPPVDDGFRPGHDPREHFTRWEDPADYDRLQRKCWKVGFSGVSLEDGGHDVRFAERRLFPLRFLMRHYPIRGQAHGTRKVLRERTERFAADEVAMGWHRQYAHVRGVDHLFMKNPASLRAFDLERVRLETTLEDGRMTPALAATEPEPEAAPVKGFLDQVSHSSISGWAAHEDTAGEPLTVELWDGPRLTATVVADDHRRDLERDGVRGGRAGFAIRTPRELLDGRPHWIWATAAGTALARSPMVFTSVSRPPVDPPVTQAESAAVG